VELEIEALVNCLSHSGAIQILKSLKSGAKRQKDLILTTRLDKTIIWRRIKELIDFGLIQITVMRDTPTGSKAYELTPLGRKIVQLIEEMEKEFEEYHSQAPPKDPEEFIGEVLKEE
jgi:DNA-binding HxlR family transcriptional regulator